MSTTEATASRPKPTSLPGTTSTLIAQVGASGAAGSQSDPGGSRQRDPSQNRGATGKSKQGGQVNGKPGVKLRGLEKDSPEVRVSKTLSWLLRHGAKGEGLVMRPDGYVRVTDLLENPKLKSQALDLADLERIVKADAKQRYDLISEPGVNSTDSIWWMRARQGHSIKTVKLDLTAINSLADLPTGVAVHGTNAKAWESISTQGLSKMKRNHIHLAQGVAGDNVISGMRNSSQILIFIDVQKALDEGIKFFLSDNGVILTEGDEQGILGTRFFKRVENAKRTALAGWEGTSDSAVGNTRDLRLR